MKILKRILIILAIIIGALAVIGFLMPREQHVERSLLINAHPENVFAQINNLKNWANWSPWMKLDPNSKIEYSEPAEGAGAFYTWDSEKSEVGKGKMTILESQPGSLITTQLDFQGMEPSTGYFKFETTNEGTMVTWAYDGNMGSNPFYRLMGLMMDKMLGKFFEEGLASIKTAAQNAPEPVDSGIIAPAVSDTTTSAE